MQSHRMRGNPDRGNGAGREAAAVARRAPGAPVTFRGTHVVRQAAYAALLAALVMAASTLNWFGAPAVRTYAVFFLTQSIDVGDVLSRLGGWAADRGPGRWRLPWLGGEPREEPLDPGRQPPGFAPAPPGQQGSPPRSHAVPPGSYNAGLSGSYGAAPPGSHDPATPGSHAPASPGSHARSAASPAPGSQGPPAVSGSPVPARQPVPPYGS